MYLVNRQGINHLKLFWLESLELLETCRLDRQHVGISDQDYHVGGIQLYLFKRAPGMTQLHVEQESHLCYGSWVQDPSPLLPYVRETFPVVVVCLQPNPWLLQAQLARYI